ncbi:hypothetical protein [Caulobacter sp. CCH9-E1]|jgi:hypothetical protein|uniref:hypothetical protein n=1 Tax=Caulobacter sp. CCH9-E1 TaxID=1768768 RepID=UPI000836F08F|nr:hypothetical protein [Caulobacter sp. CCH9-E1]
MDTDEKIRAFRASISSNLLAGDDFIDWQVVEQHLKSSSSAILHIQCLVDGGGVDRNGLEKLLRDEPSVYPLLLDLIAFNTSGTQVEKWGLPQLISHDQGRTAWVWKRL